MHGFSKTRMEHFNPRTREGCDFFLHINFSFYLTISIHAPVKGATMAVTLAHSYTSDFNPRTREGCDEEGEEVPFPYPEISIHAPVKGATRVLCIT